MSITPPTSGQSWQMSPNNPRPQPDMGPPKKKTPGWVWALIGCGGMGCLTVPIIAAILFPVFAMAREKARQSSCMSNEKQIGLALLQYSQDNDEVLPAGSEWMKKTEPYLLSGRSVYQCPSFRQSSYGYAYNSAVSRKGLEKIASPGTTPTIYDSTRGEPNASDAMTSLPAPGRHRGGNDIGYADGHVKYVKTGASDAGSGN